MLARQSEHHVSHPAVAASSSSRCAPGPGRGQGGRQPGSADSREARRLGPELRAVAVSAATGHGRYRCSLGRSVLGERARHGRLQRLQLWLGFLVVTIAVRELKNDERTLLAPLAIHRASMNQ